MLKFYLNYEFYRHPRVYLIIIAFLFYNKNAIKQSILYQVMLNASGFGWNILISLSCCGLTFDKHANVLIEIY